MVSKVISRILVAALGIGVMVTPVVNSTDAAALTLDPDTFPAGNLISDSLFYDGSAMTASQVQRFLDSKVSSCSSSSSNDCLKDYRVDIRAKSADAQCDAIPARSNASAAEAIVAVAQACGISPRVLLVTLEKEQGLVTSTSPSDRMYQIAMGYACPDSGSCDSAYYGLFNQLYRAAWQFQRYYIYPGNYRFRAGGTYDIGYSPSSSCGTKRVNIQNSATAGLYNYTPYTPNDAAIKAYPGTAPCGAYGNRNFYAIYTLWFGSTQQGILIRTKGNDNWWLVSHGERWSVPEREAELQRALGAFGGPTVVEPSVVNGYDYAGEFEGLMLGTGGTGYVIGPDGRYLAGTCTDLAVTSYDCAGAPVFDWNVISLLSYAGALGDDIAVAQGERVLLKDGSKHRIVGAEGVALAGVPEEPPVTLATSAGIDGVPWGLPFIGSGTVVTSIGRDYWYVVDGEDLLTVPRDLRFQTKLTTWLGWTKVDLTFAERSLYGDGGDFPVLMSIDGSLQALTIDGLRVVGDAASWPEPQRDLGSNVVDGIPGGDPLPADGVVLLEASGGDVSLIEDGVRRRASHEDAVRLLLASDLVAEGVEVPDRLNHLLPLGAAASPPGVVIQSDTSSAKWFIESSGERRLTTYAAMAETSPFAIVSVPQEIVDSYERSAGVVGPVWRCDGELQVMIDGRAHPVRPDAVAYYESTATVLDYPAAICDTVPASSARVGRLLRSGGQYWLLQADGRTPISQQRYDEFKMRLGYSRTVSAGFLSFISVR